MKKALIVVDVQNDFCPGGALGIENADTIIPTINKLMQEGNYDVIVLTQDWHPEGHISFIGSKLEADDIRGGVNRWKPHCVQGTWGADFHPLLDTRLANIIIRKGTKVDLDSYSAFLENDKETPTGLQTVKK